MKNEMPAKRHGGHNVYWHPPQVHRVDRERGQGHRATVLWFTGLSGSGKSTVAHALESALHARGIRTFALDGDNVRHGLNSDLGFTEGDRAENLRRIGELCKLFVEAGVVVLAAFISPLRRDRERVRSLVPHGDFIEIYVKCSLDVCEQRDPKGIYKRARAGEIANFTGISAPYEEPSNPDITLDTAALRLEEEVEAVVKALITRGVIQPQDHD